MNDLTFNQFLGLCCLISPAVVVWVIFISYKKRVGKFIPEEVRVENNVVMMTK